MDFDTSNKTKQVMATIAVMLVVVLVVFGAKAFDKDDMHRTNNIIAANAATESSPTPTPTASTAPSVPVAATPATATSYKNGTYSAGGTYSSPGGLQSIGVRLTIQSDTVVGATVTDQATDRDSEEYQLMFIGGYKKYVVGKSVNSIHLSYVSGSSLTSQGFNNALEQIKRTAHA